MANTAAILAKWKANSGRAGEAYKKGVDAVTTAPTAKAAAAADKYLTRIMEAVQSGRYAASLNAVSLQEWKDASREKGAKNYVTGVNAISPRAMKAMADQQQYAERVKQEIASMPNNSEADAEARMLRAVKLMREFKGSR